MDSPPEGFVYSHTIDLVEHGDIVRPGRHTYPGADIYVRGRERWYRRVSLTGNDVLTLRWLEIVRSRG